METEDTLIEGIKTLLKAAEYEHYDIDILKHLLQTVAFAKKFVETTKFEVYRRKFSILILRNICKTLLLCYKYFSIDDNRFMFLQTQVTTSRA